MKDSGTENTKIKLRLKGLDEAIRRVTGGVKKPKPSRPPLPPTFQVRVSSTKQDFFADMGYPLPRGGPPTENQIKTRTSKLYSHLKARCQRGVGNKYIYDMINLSENKNLETDPRFQGRAWRYFALRGRGFAIGRFLDKERFGAPIFFIDLICSSDREFDATAALFEKIESVAMSAGCTKVWLTSVEGATGAYQWRGYTFGPLCEHDTAYPPGAKVVPRLDGTPFNIMGGPPTPARHFRIKHLQTRNGDHVNGAPPDHTYLMTKCLHYPNSNRPTPSAPPPAPARIRTPQPSPKHISKPNPNRYPKGLGVGLPARTRKKNGKKNKTGQAASTSKSR